MSWGMLPVGASEMLLHTQPPHPQPKQLPPAAAARLPLECGAPQSQTHMLAEPSQPSVVSRPPPGFPPQPLHQLPYPSTSMMSDQTISTGGWSTGWPTFTFAPQQQTHTEQPVTSLYQSQMCAPTFSGHADTMAFHTPFPVQQQLMPPKALTADPAAVTFSSMPSSLYPGDSNSSFQWNSPTTLLNSSAFSPGQSPSSCDQFSPLVRDSAVHVTPSFEQLMMQSTPLHTRAFTQSQMDMRQQDAAGALQQPSQHSSYMNNQLPIAQEPNRGRAAGFPRGSTWASQMSLSSRSSMMQRTYQQSSMSQQNHSPAQLPMLMARRNPSTQINQMTRGAAPGTSAGKVLLCTFIHLEYKVRNSASSLLNLCLARPHSIACDVRCSGRRTRTTSRFTSNAFSIWNRSSRR